MSSVSAVFYSLSERQRDHEGLGCNITLVDQIHIKIECRVDTADRHDTLELRLICTQCLEDVRKTSIFVIDLHFCQSLFFMQIAGNNIKRSEASAIAARGIAFKARKPRRRGKRMSIGV